MLTNSGSLALLDAPLWVLHGALPEEGPTEWKTKANVAPTPAIQGADWVQAMMRIQTARDEAAFADVFRHYAPRVKSFLMKSGAHEALADECTQDVMATIWNKAHLYDPSRASLATWIFTIARNRRIDLIRRARRPEPEELGWGPDNGPEQSEILALKQETGQLGIAMAQLPEMQRTLIERAYFGDQTQSEIAADTGLPLGTIKSRIRLALDRLRHEMKKR